jgi:hypothetical protein
VRNTFFVYQEVIGYYLINKKGGVFYHFLVPGFENPFELGLLEEKEFTDE